MWVARPVGRPKYRWRDEVEKDLRELKADDWRELAEAKIHFGSTSHQDEVSDEKEIGPDVQINFPESVMSRIEEMMGETEQFDNTEVFYTPPLLMN
ncbi:unnamed protein product [Plutella xylostella]|uniref:(diamondback moth) hypothetical protein n=1 Tax=Plutella xylostella TaxID=51655 RepID=A0A8S4FZA9_PLUXY|nr:unnamed protein product [Plutella xylostella]